MSTEQSEAGQSPTPPVETSNSVAITQQATTPTPTALARGQEGLWGTPTPKLAKNPKRVAAGKAVAERTRLAREQQKKAAAEAAVIIANNKTAPPGAGDLPHSTEMRSASVEKSGDRGVTPSSLSTTQWIGVISIAVSLIGIYYKREELKAAFSRGGSPQPQGRAPALQTPSDESQPVRLTVFRKNTPEPQPARAKQPRGVKHLD